MHLEAQRSHKPDKLAVNSSSSSSPTTASPHNSRPRPLRMAENRSQMFCTLRRMLSMIPWAIGKMLRGYPVPLSPIAFEGFRRPIERRCPLGKLFLIIRIMQTFARERYSVSRLHRTLRPRTRRVCRDSRLAEVVHPTMRSMSGPKTLPFPSSKIHINCTGPRIHCRSQKQAEAAAHQRLILQYIAAMSASKVVIVVTVSMTLPGPLKDGQAAQADDMSL